MPARSKKQRRMMAIAEHHPEMLRKANKGVLSMTKGQMHDFAKTKEKKLPEKKYAGKGTRKRLNTVAEKNMFGRKSA